MTARVDSAAAATSTCRGDEARRRRRGYSAAPPPFGRDRRGRSQRPVAATPRARRRGDQSRRRRGRGADVRSRRRRSAETGAQVRAAAPDGLRVLRQVPRVDGRQRAARVPRAEAASKSPSRRRRSPFGLILAATDCGRRPLYGHGRCRHVPSQVRGFYGTDDKRATLEKARPTASSFRLRGVVLERRPPKQRGGGAPVEISEDPLHRDVSP